MTGTLRGTADAWPALRYADWAPTRRTLHMVSQMVGKARLALVPPRPEWLHAGLFLDPRGLTSGAVPFGSVVLAIGIDVFDSALWIRVSDGRETSLPIGPDRSVAAIWADFRAALARLGLELDLWDKPQELGDVRRFADNTADRAIEPEHAQRFHRLLCSIDGAFETFRSPFFGRSEIRFWWGSFDFAVLLFTGAHVTPPDDRGYIMRYDLDAQAMSAGFWPGDDDTPEPRLYAYLSPPPDGCERAPIEPAHAQWAESMAEWILPWEQVRSTADPGATIGAFLRSVERFAVTDGGWNAEAHRYVTPPPAPRDRELPPGRDRHRHRQREPGERTPER